MNRPGVLVFSIIGICGIVALSVYEGVCLYRKRKDETTAKSDRTKADARDGAPPDDQTIRNKKPPQGKHGGKR